MGYVGRYQKDKPSDDRGRTRAGRARDRVLDRDSDHGAPTEASGKRADRRASHTQIVRTGIFGGTKVIDGRRAGDLKDRWHR